MSRPLTFRSFFSGGGIADIGAIDAGFTPVSAVEFNPSRTFGSADCIAHWYRKNIGDHCICEDILTVDKSQFGDCDLMHFSPTCVSFSVAKTGGAELQVDIDMATACADIIEANMPRAVTVENVRAYRTSKSLAVIVKRLLSLGYQYHCDVYDAADFAVPQNRDRMILRAVLNGPVPPLIRTHCDPKKLAHADQATMFGFDELLPWNGWYKSVEDLLPGLPDSRLADWQHKRIPSELRNLLVGSEFPSRLGPIFDLEHEPVNTITSNAPGHFKALLVGVQGENGELAREVDTPSPTITSAHQPEKYRAFLVSPQTSDKFGGNVAVVRDGDEPTIAVTASATTKAFIVHATDQRSMPVREAHEPLFTQVAMQDNVNFPRAFVQLGGKTDFLPDDAPSNTVVSGNANTGARAVLLSDQTTGCANGRVVKLNARCLARLMTVPDWYELPTSNSLAGRIIGNGIPSLFYQRIAESLLPALNRRSR